MKNFFLFITIIFFFGCEKIKENNEILNIGIVAPVQPFSFYEKNNLYGFSIDLGNLIAQKLNKKVIFTVLETKTASIFLENKIVDVIIGVSETEARRKNFLFSKVYLKKNFCLIFKKEKNITEKNFLNFKIGIVLNSVPYEFFEKYYPNKERTFINSYLDGLIMLEKDLIDIIFSLEFSGKFMAKTNNFDYMIYENNQDFGHSFLIRKKDLKLKKEINLAIDQIIEEGWIAKLKEKYDMN